MSEASESVGVDRVLLKEDGTLVIHSVRDMPDWKITRYRKLAVVYRERVYFIDAKTRLPPRGIRYLLRPWPEDTNDPARATIHYDADYVREREELRVAQGHVEREAVALWALTPLLGFLPSGIKLLLNERYAIDPVGVTMSSVFLEALAALCAGALLAIHVFTRAFGADALGGLFRWIICVIVIGALDGSIRYHSVLAGTLRQYGFLEWLFRWWLTDKK